MKILRIRAHLQTAIISDQFLPLDSVMYYHAVRDRFGSQDYSLPGQSTIKEFGMVGLPFEKRGQGSAWYYACSFAQWPENRVEDKTFYVKQVRTQYSDLVDFRGKRGKIQNKRGRYKSYHVDVYYRHSLHLDWYAVGDKDEIDKLLMFCTHLGKKTSQGWGSVREWEVTEWPEDWSEYGPTGKLMRALPERSGDFVYGIRPSYWHRKHHFNCIMP